MWTSRPGRRWQRPTCALRPRGWRVASAMLTNEMPTRICHGVVQRCVERERRARVCSRHVARRRRDGVILPRGEGLERTVELRGERQRVRASRAAELAGSHRSDDHVVADDLGVGGGCRYRAVGDLEREVRVRRRREGEARHAGTCRDRERHAHVSVAKRRRRTTLVTRARRRARTASWRLRDRGPRSRPSEGWGCRRGRSSRAR